MLLAIECIIACLLFTLMIIPSQIRNPVGHILSYPKSIRRRAESLPQYQDTIRQTENRRLSIKIASVIVLAILLAATAYFSGAADFWSAFRHVFIIFLSVNLYDVFILDLLFFCHSSKVIIPGTEDMVNEYRNPVHHIKGGFAGLAIGTFVSLLSAGLIALTKIL